MCNSVPSCESVETVMLRVAVEIESTAKDLAGVETRVADIMQRVPVRADDLEQLQALDRIGQQMRALGIFLESALACRCGRINVARALDEVWLESVRARLGGGTASASAGGEVEVW